jgi:hypothetical protein
MKEYDVIIKTVAEGLRSIAQGVEKIAEKLEESAPKKQPKAKRKPARKTKTKPAPKKAPAKKATAADTVLAIINRSKKGVDSATLSEKNGYDKKKIGNIVFKLRKLGKIKSLSKGVYVKA